MGLVGSRLARHAHLWTNYGVHGAFRVLTLFGLGLLGGCVQSPARQIAAPKASNPPFYLGGIQVNEDDHAEWVSTLKGAGFNTVATTVYAKHGDWDTDNLWYEDEEPAVISEIRASKQGGLKVVLVLRVALDHAFEKNQFLWHGMIRPTTDAQLKEWFRRYGKFVDKWAKIAQTEGVDVLAIGSEMNSLAATTPVTEIPELESYYLSDVQHARYLARLRPHRGRIKPRHLRGLGGAEFPNLEAFFAARHAVHKAWAQRMTYGGDLEQMNMRRRKQQAHWQTVIRIARASYSGKLSYAANFDQYTTVGFWRDLDIMGINAYFPLRERPGQTELPQKLKKGWGYIFSGIDAFRKRANVPKMPVIFTELGYTRKRNCTVHSWAMNGFEVFGTGDDEMLAIWEDEPRDLKERSQAVEALYGMSQQFPGLLQGILYWKLSTKPWHVKDEPFVLIVEPQASDPLQTALLKWSRK